MSAYCEDCGTRCSGGICPNCHEELLILVEQEYDTPSGDFLRKAEEQRKQIQARGKQ